MSEILERNGALRPSFCLIQYRQYIHAICTAWIYCTGSIQSAHIFSTDSIYTAYTISIYSIYQLYILPVYTISTVYTGNDCIYSPYLYIHSVLYTGTACIQFLYIQSILYIQVLTVYVACTCTILQCGYRYMGLHVQCVRYRHTTSDYIYSTCNKGTGTSDYIYIGMKAGRRLQVKMCSYK